MSVIRVVRQVFVSQPTVEGAGVRLRRAFGFGDPKLFDPFLLMDDFRSDNPTDYQRGFPWHPHRGIETITYVLRGSVAHGDSMGNQDVIHPGEVQWMTAGSGVYHQEMPAGDAQGAMHGFQLWANLPASHKMMDPRYRGVTQKEIPIVGLENGGEILVVAGTVGSVRGPVQDVVIDPLYLDVRIPGGASWEYVTPPGHTVFAYVIEGSLMFGPDDLGESRAAYQENRRLVLMGPGDLLRARAAEGGGRFILVAGCPLGEPVAWYGPIVMNTEAELRLAIQELQQGTFIKVGGNR
jgi:hypothetical protein